MDAYSTFYIIILVLLLLIVIYQWKKIRNFWTTYINTLNKSFLSFSGFILGLYIGFLFSANNPESYLGVKFNIINSIFISYYCGFIIYFMTSHIPDVDRRRSTQPYMKRWVDAIIKEAETTLQLENEYNNEKLCKLSHNVNEYINRLLPIIYSFPKLSEVLFRLSNSELCTKFDQNYTYPKPEVQLAINEFEGIVEELKNIVEK